MSGLAVQARSVDFAVAVTVALSEAPTHGMAYLLVVSLVWAFSFGLIKGNLKGLDPSFVALVRMALSLLFFAPFFRTRGLEPRPGLVLIAIGAVQYGLMYVLYIAAYQHLDAHQVALFTVFTPLFVVAIDDLWERRFRPAFLLAAALAVGGAAVLVGSSVDPRSLGKGFLLMQGANLCFALGQVWYRRLESQWTQSIPHRSIFALLYLGAAMTTGIATLLTPSSIPATLTFTQVWTLAYLGIVASGICFFLWNVGATKTNAALLAVFNNVKVPLAVVVSLVVFGESTDLFRLGASGGLIVLALWLGHRLTAKPAGTGNGGGSRPSRA